MTWNEYEKELNESRIPGLFTDFEWDNYKYKCYKKFVAGIIPDVATEIVPACEVHTPRRSAEETSGDERGVCD